MYYYYFINNTKKKIIYATFKCNNNVQHSDELLLATCPGCNSAFSQRQLLLHHRDP